MEPNTHHQLESLDKHTLTRLIVNMQQQVAAQTELLQQLQGMLADDRISEPTPPELAPRELAPQLPEVQSESSCPYCQCEWVYRRN